MMLGGIELVHPTRYWAAFNPSERYPDGMQEVDGHPRVIEGCEWLVTYYWWHQSQCNVTDAVTGALLGRGKTIGAALDKAKAALDARGKVEYERMQEYWLTRHPLSPRYRRTQP